MVYALRAAESAVRIYAYEEALLHYDHAIETLESGGLMHDERLARAYILKGSALYDCWDRSNVPSKFCSRR